MEPYHDRLGRRPQVLRRVTDQGDNSYWYEETMASYLLPKGGVMAQQEFVYKRFEFTASISALQGNRGIVTVDVVTSDQARIADLGTERFLHLERWVERNDAAFLQVVVDECKVTVDHYAEIGLLGFALISVALGGVNVPVSGPQAFAWQPQFSLTRNY